MGDRAHYESGHGEAQQIAPGRAGQRGRAAPVGEDGEAHSAGGEVLDLADESEARSQDAAGQQNQEYLPGNRYRSERQRHLYSRGDGGEDGEGGGNGQLHGHSASR